MKTMILCHADCDGMCAAAVALAMYPEASVFFTKPVSFLVDLADAAADRLIICDIAITKSRAAEICAKIADMARGSEVMYFDHHELPVPGKARDLGAVHYHHEESASSSELAYRHFQKDIPAEREWLGLYGAIADYKMDTPFTNERLLNWDRRSIYFQVATLVLGIKDRRFDSYDAKRMIVRALSSGKAPSEISGLVEAARDSASKEAEVYAFVKAHAKRRKSFGYVEDELHFGFRGPAALFSASVTGSPVGLCISMREKGIDVTARRRTRGIALNQLMEQASEPVGGSGGGLPDAAGARIPRDSLEGFLSKVEQLLRKAQ